MSVRDGAESADEAAPRWRRPLSVVAVLLLGLVFRFLLVAAAPRYGYPWDHFEILGMGLVAAERGLVRAYSAPPDVLPTLRGWVVRDGKPVQISRPGVYPPNYPPIAETVFWAQSRWLGAGDPGFVANTPFTRFVTSLAPWVFELLTALGVGGLAAALAGSSAVGLAAGMATWLAPPLMLNTTFFGQYDALALAPAVFAIWAMVRARWALAGVAVGIGLLAKPQGLLMLPVAAFAVAVAPPGGLVATAQRAVLLAGVALATLLVGRAPWILADGTAWFRRCYRMNLFEVLPFTTLEAFNVWYLVGLVTERQPVFDVRVSTAVVAGLTRDAWGRILLTAALAASATLAWRHRRRPALAIVVFALLWLWSVFIWPTRVHERYILYSLPCMLVAAIVMPRLRLAAAAVLLVGTMEHSWMVWRSGPTLGSLDRQAVQRLHDERFQAYWRDRPVTIENAKAGPKQDESTALAFARHRDARRNAARVEWALTLLSLAAYVGTVVVLSRRDTSTPSRADDLTDDVLVSSG